MTKIVTTTTKTFTLADGRSFPTLAEANAAQDTSTRTAKVEALLTAKELAAPLSVAEVVALGKDLIAALTLPAKMGPKPKAAAAAQA